MPTSPNPGALRDRVSWRSQRAGGAWSDLASEHPCSVTPVSFRPDPLYLQDRQAQVYRILQRPVDGLVPHASLGAVTESRGRSYEVEVVSGRFIGNLRQWQEVTCVERGPGGSQI